MQYGRVAFGALQALRRCPGPKAAPPTARQDRDGWTVISMKKDWNRIFPFEEMI
jgi:hypothetical protein